MCVRERERQREGGGKDGGSVCSRERQREGGGGKDVVGN